MSDTDPRPITATEINARWRELENEWLRRLCERALVIMRMRGLLPPEPPDFAS